jgi:hypothetical protein
VFRDFKPLAKSFRYEDTHCVKFIPQRRRVIRRFII